jgi:hypothetical protein
MLLKNQKKMLCIFLNQTFSFMVQKLSEILIYYQKSKKKDIKLKIQKQFKILEKPKTLNLVLRIILQPTLTCSYN